MSGTLTCDANNCIHNISGLCSAKKIDIQGIGGGNNKHTQCGTFEGKGIKNAITSVFNMNVAGEIKQIFSSSNIAMNPIINCDTITCRFNINRNCGADFIQIHEGVELGSNRTECETFQQ
ncbi:MAG: DUF1540 domain-containing protein [Clostridium sp.]|uniref:DUF1540 domain-containing protein n=1 Tax=Clostridium sp. TaxID=1506 RepID=UPI00307007B1